MRYLSWLMAAVLLLAASGFALNWYFIRDIEAEKEFVASGDEPDLPPDMQKTADKEEFFRLRNEYFGLLRGIEAGKPFDPRDRVDGIRQMEAQQARLNALPESETKDALLAAWTELGPAPIPDGQTNAPRSNVSGRTVTIAIHPTNPDIVYVGAAQGGLYRSTNGGADWTPLTDSLLSLSSGAVVHVPISAGEPDTILYGTGEASFSADGFFGVGIYRIRNASSASPVIEGPFATGTGGGDVFYGSAISEILVNPADPNMIFVSTTSAIGGIGPATPPLPKRGVYRSTNAMSANPTFEHLTVSTANGGDRSVSDIIADPNNFNHLIASVVDRIVGGVQLLDGGVYLSTDALSATPTFTRTLTTGTTTTSSRTELALHTDTSTNPDTLTVYAASGLGDGTVHRSTDGGATWTQRIDNNFCSPQCFYDIGINVDPNNPDRVYLAGSPAVVFATSTNGGTSFVQTAAGLHVDSHVIAIAPSNPTVLYFGSDGGIYRSNNSGGTWINLNNSTYRATQFVSIATHPIDPNYSIGGTQDNGTNMMRPDGTWVHIADGDGGYTVIDSNSVDNEVVTMYHTFYNSRQVDILTPNTGAQIRYEVTFSTTTAESRNWVSRGCMLGVPNNGITCTDGTLFYAPLELGPGVPNPVYFGSDRLYRSADTGNSHIIASQAPIEPVGMSTPPVGNPISAIGIAPQNDLVRMVGMRFGGLWGTTTGLPTLVDLDPATLPDEGMIPNRFIARTVIAPNDQNTAYVTLSAFGVPSVWKTTSLNSLADNVAPTWTAASTGLPQVPVSAFVIDPVTNVLYAGTDIGVYMSSNGGASWQPFGTGLPRVAVFDMAIAPGNMTTPRKVRIATHGRGFWDIPVFVAPTAATVSVSGRVTNEDGFGIPRASVSITDGAGGIRQALTNPFGYYKFDDVGVGQNYVFRVFAKRYQFEPRVIFVTEDMENLDFTASGSSRK